jgi:hypothetical protein
MEKFRSAIQDSTKSELVENAERISMDHQKFKDILSQWTGDQEEFGNDEEESGNYQGRFHDQVDDEWIATRVML